MVLTNSACVPMSWQSCPASGWVAAAHCCSELSAQPPGGLFHPEAAVRFARAPGAAAYLITCTATWVFHQNVLFQNTFSKQREGIFQHQGIKNQNYSRSQMFVSPRMCCCSWMLKSAIVPAVYFARMDHNNGQVNTKLAWIKKMHARDEHVCIFFKTKKPQI